MKQIPERIDSKFRYVLLAATRAEQMMQGARPKVEVDVEEGKWATFAMQEISSDLVDWDYGPEPAEDAEEEADDSE